MHQYPALHGAVALRPDTAHTRPAGQMVEFDMPVDGQYVPGSHGVSAGDWRGQ
jgi:hypothetical protein